MWKFFGFIVCCFLLSCNVDMPMGPVGLETSTNCCVLDTYDCECFDMYRCEVGDYVFWVFPENEYITPDYDQATGFCTNCMIDQ